MKEYEKEYYYCNFCTYTNFFVGLEYNSTDKIAKADLTNSKIELPINPNLRNNNNPEPIYKANKDLPTNNFKSEDELINRNILKEKGGTIKIARQLTYSQYINQYNIKDKSYNISSDRVIWVIQVHYPNGIQTRIGFLKDAILTGIYDAQTGELLEMDYTGIPETMLQNNK